MECWNDNALACNQWAIKNGDKALLIEASSDVDSKLETFLSDVKELIIVMTHGHFDHIAYAKKIKNYFTNKGLVVTIKASIKEAMFYGEEGQKIFDGYINQFNLASYSNLEVTNEVVFLNDKDSVGYEDFIVEEVAGHSPGSIIVYSKKSLQMFTGDLLFADGGVGRTDFPLGDHEAMERSLAKVFSFNEDFTIYPGHGNCALLQSQRKYFRQFAKNN